MMGFFIAVLSICLGAAIPLTAIVTAHKRSSMKLQTKLLDKEVELERIRLETYTAETEKLRLELEHSKQLLIETRKE